MLCEEENISYLRKLFSEVHPANTVVLILTLATMIFM